MRAGVVYVVLAAASAALLLFLPVLLLGYTFSVLATVARGEGLAWASVVGMSYAFIGIPSVLGMFLLIVPYRLLRAAGRRIGTRRSIRWVGGLLVAWNAVVAFIWAGEALSAFTPAMDTDEIWYAVAFGLTAVVLLIALILAERRAVRAAAVLGGVLAVAVITLVVATVAVWGSPLRIPPGAQVVHIVLADSEVHLDPATVHEGDVYFVIEGPDARPDQAMFTLITGGGGQCPPCDMPLPVSDQTVAGLADGDLQGTTSEGGWFGDSPVKYTLREGNYVFLIPGPGGLQPAVLPLSMAVLEVLP